MSLVVSRRPLGRGPGWSLDAGGWSEGGLFFAGRFGLGDLRLPGFVGVFGRFGGGGGGDRLRGIGFAVGAEDVAGLVLGESGMGGDLGGDAFFDGGGEVGGVRADGGDVVLDVAGQFGGEVGAFPRARCSGRVSCSSGSSRRPSFISSTPRDEFHDGAVVGGGDDRDALLDDEVVEEAED